MDILIGQIASAVQLQGSISGEEQLKGSFDLFKLPEHQYEGSYTVTPTESEQVLPTSGRTPLSNITVSPIPSEYIIPSGTVTITQSSGADVTQYASADVQSASIQKSYEEEFYTNAGGNYMFHLQPHVEVQSAGWTDTGEKYGWNHIYRAMPFGVTVTPSESVQYVGYSNTNTMLEGRVTVDAIPSDYVGTSIPRHDSSDIYPDAGYTVVTPSGYYESDGVFQVPYETHTAPSISYDSSGLITAIHYQESEKLCIGSDLTSNTLQLPSASVSSYFSYGYSTIGGSKAWTIECGESITDGWIGASSYSDSYWFGVVPSGTVITPTESSQTAGHADYMMEDAITVSPIPSEYVIPSGTIEIENGGDTDVAGYETADVPYGSLYAGYDSSYVTSSGVKKWRVRGNATAVSGWLDGQHAYGEYDYYDVVPSGTTVTPSTSSQTIGGTNYMMQSAVTVSPIPSQYIVPSGTISISSNGTVDVTQYASASISVPSSAPNLQNKTFTVSAYGTASVSADAGYDGLSKVTITTPSGTAKAPTSISQTGATITTGTNSLILTKNNVSVTPSVSAGYISSGTATNVSITLSATTTIQGASTYYPSTADQTISSSRYLTGTQTFKGVTTSNLTAGNIKSGVVVQVGDSADSDRILSVTGTYSGGGGGDKNVQIAQSTTRATSSTYVKCCGDITVATTGTYDVYWTYFRSSTSGTWGSQLYINDVSQGTTYSTFTNHVCNVHISNVSLTANQKVSVYARSRGSNYYGYIGQLVIIES